MMPSDYEKEKIDEIDRFFKKHIGFAAMFVVAVLAAAGVLKIEWPILAAFGLAMLPYIAEFVQEIRFDKEGASVALRSGKKKREDLPVVADPQVNAQAAAVPAFATLPEDNRRILKTLWNFQVPHDSTLQTRWGFSVPPGVFSYSSFVRGIADLMSRSMIHMDSRGLVFLLDAGVTYCQTHSAEIAREPLFYREFKPA